MESLFFLAVLVFLGIPVLAIVALVRTGSLRRRLDEQAQAADRSFAELRRELAKTRGEVSQLSQELNKLREAAGAAAAAAVVTEPAKAAPTEAAKPEPTVAKATVVEPSNARKIAPPAVSAPAPEAPKPAPPVAPAKIEPVRVSAAATPPPAPRPVEPPRFTTTPSAPRYQPYNAPQVKSLLERLRHTLPLEELLGMNLFAKLGIILLVIGFALLGRVALVAMGPAAKVALLYVCGAAMLGGGIWLEKNERYHLIGRAGIGGGWALLYFTTFAMRHVDAMHVMDSVTANCALLLAVAAAMVAHTLRYRSQLVTGLALLLGFATVALSQDTVYSLAAGAILALGTVAIALRMKWFELEVFGILASYLNHLYWLYKLYPHGVAHHAFPQFWPSVTILVLYWLAFRFSYIVRKVGAAREEQVSTVAALLNTSLLLAVMKAQSTHPELTFYALFALGVLEFLGGQLPITRRRRAAFVLLTVLGTLLAFAAVPFRFSGNSIALLWMIAAEMLLVAGIAQREKIFRRLGLLAAILTGALVLYGSRGTLKVSDGVLLLACALCFYLNAHLLYRKWRELFAGYEPLLATVHGYIGAATAMLGAWAVFAGDWTAVAWAALLVLSAAGTRHLKERHLLWQAWLLGGSVVARAVLVNLHTDAEFPHHVTLRLITLPLLAAAYYLTSRLVRGSEELPLRLESVSLWAGSVLLAALAWYEVAPAWVALAWVGMGIVLVLVGRRAALSELCYQENVLIVLAAMQLGAVNLDEPHVWLRVAPICLSAAAMFALSRFAALHGAALARPAAWMHTALATALLTALAWHEAPEMWMAPISAAFALLLMAVDRRFAVEEFPFYSHLLAAAAMVQTVGINLRSDAKWHGLDARLITVSLVVLALYALARWTKLPERWRQQSAHHVYSWVASLFAAWMLWAELQPVAVAVGLALLGLLLFEAGAYGKAQQLRLQGYAALAASFGRIFLVNLTAAAQPGEAISPRIYTVLPLAAIYFYVWWRLQPAGDAVEEQRWPVGAALAYLGTGSIVALLYFQSRAEWIIAAWSCLLLVLLAAELLLGKRVFVQQATLLAVATVTRGLAHNIFGESYFTRGGWHGRFSVLAAAALLMLAALGLALRLRTRYAAQPATTRLGRLFDYPEQVLFFAPVVLVTTTLAVKMTSGMVTLSLALEGVAVILGGLLLAQRSYRLTGLLLLVACVAKIVARDAWLLSDRDRYVTFIVLGGGLTLVSMLYNRYRETVRRLL